MQYTQDYDETLLIASSNLNKPMNDGGSQEDHCDRWRTDGSCANGNPVHFAAAMYPYLKSVQIFVCPSAPKSGWSSDFQPGDNPISYVWNITYSNRSLASINAPADKVWVYDRGTTIHCSQSVTWNMQDGFPANWGDWPPAHTDGRVLGFVDGHVKYFIDTSSKGQRGLLAGP